MDLSVLRNKRVLMTGDTGFKGAWLSTWLTILGAEVHGLALAPAKDAPLFRQLGLDKLVRHTDGDIREFDTVARAVAIAKPDVVFHLAAQSLVIDGYKFPRETFETNVMGSVNVMDALRQAGSAAVLIYVTTDKVYRNRELGRSFREDDELGGVEPYGASKAAAEIAFAAYQESYFVDENGLAAASVRAGNVIGGGDWAANRIVPDCVRAFRSSQPVVLRNPDSVRPWQHVLEPLSGYLRLAAALVQSPAQYRGAWNFGPDTASMTTVRALAERAADCWGGGRIEVVAEADAPYEAERLYLDSTKAREELGWRPIWAFEKAVSETIHWYKALENGADAFTETERQIIAYMGDAA